MDATSFDALVRRLSTGTSRRRLIGVVGLLGLRGSSAIAAPRPGLGARCKPNIGCKSGQCINRVCACESGERRCGSACIANSACCNADGERRCNGQCISGNTCCTAEGERRCGSGCITADECCHAEGERQCPNGRCVTGSRYCSADECPPINNGNSCVDVVLNQNGECVTRNTVAGKPCGGDDIMSCDGDGRCLEIACSSVSDCPGRDGECKRRRCRSGRCEWVFDPYGTPVSQQNRGDCLVITCDGGGGRISLADPSDVPQRSIACPNPRCEGADLVCQ